MPLSATGCDGRQRRPDTVVGGAPGARHRSTRNDRRGTDQPRAFAAAAAGTFDRRDRARQRAFPPIVRRCARDRRRAISASRSRHRQRGDPGIFRRPQPRGLLACPRRQREDWRNFPVRKLGTVVREKKFPASGMRDHISVGEVRTRSGKSGQCVCRSSRTIDSPCDPRSAANGCLRRQTGGNDPASIEVSLTPRAGFEFGSFAERTGLWILLSSFPCSRRYRTSDRRRSAPST